MNANVLRRKTVKALKRENVKTPPPAAASTLQRCNASTIMISNRQRTRKINTRWLKQIVSALLSELKLEGAELGVQLVGAAEMARVNRQFLGHAGSTDVITFDHRSAGDPPASPFDHLNSSFVIRHSSLRLHGELFICVDDAVAQAREFRTSWQSEVVRYAVHGVLHLLGHDDLKPALRRKMKCEENRLLRRLEQRFSLRKL